MEQSPQSEFDATSVKPDGMLIVIYSHVDFNSDERLQDEYPFFDIEHWQWSPDALIVTKNDNTVEQIPKSSILKIIVYRNTSLYLAAQRKLKAEVHLLEVQEHLYQAHVKVDRASTWLDGEVNRGKVPAGVDS